MGLRLKAGLDLNLITSGLVPDDKVNLNKFCFAQTINVILAILLRYIFVSDIIEFEPPYDKTNKMTVRPEKTQISVGIHPPSLIRVFAVRMKKKLGSLVTHSAHSEDSDHFVGFVWDGSFIFVGL